MFSIYFRTKDNRLIDNYDIAKAIYIVTGTLVDWTDIERIRKYARDCIGVACEIEEPSIEEMVKSGYKFRAIRLFREKRPDLSVKEIKSIVDEMEERFMKEKEQSTIVHVDLGAGH